MGQMVGNSPNMEVILETIEPYITENLPNLTLVDLTNAFIGFSHPHVSTRLGILDLLETKLVTLAKTNKITFSDASFILSEVCSRHIGSKLLIQNLD